MSLHNDPSVPAAFSVDETSIALNCYILTASLPPPPKAKTTTKNNINDSEQLNDLQKRVEKLERLQWNLSPKDRHITVDSNMRRARSSVESLECYSSMWKCVPKTYYDQTLEQRRAILGAHTTLQLCKSILMENRLFTKQEPKNDEEKKDDATLRRPDIDSRYILIIVQYDSVISTKKLIYGIRSQMSKSQRLTSKFDYRLASSEDNDRLTGYPNNAVCPFGLSSEEVPIILAQAIEKVEPGVMWMGGGHIHVKLGMAVKELVEKLGAYVLDVTDSRVGGGDGDDDMIGA